MPGSVRKDESSAAARLASLLDSAMDAIISVDEDQRIVLYNRAAEKIFGWPAERARGQPLSLLLPDRFRDTHGAAVRRFAATGVTSRRMSGSAVVYGRRASGEEFPVDASISQVALAGGRLFTVVLRDVTERVQAQEELAALAKEASAALEQEKARISRELHDELAQSLASLRTDLYWLRKNWRGDEGAIRRKLLAMEAVVDASAAATRRIAADLRPPVLDDVGLAPALQWLVEGFQRRAAIDCELEVDEDLDLGEPHATAVYRIVQESLANVHKHARARHVRVRVEQDSEGVRLRVRDDGIGFATGGARRPESLGLVGLRERARLLGGSVEVVSAPGEGTTVEVALPAPHATAD